MAFASSATEMSGGRAGTGGTGLQVAVQSASHLPLPVLIYVLCVVFPLSFSAGPLVLTTLRLLLMTMIIPLTVQLMMGRYGKVILTDYLFFAHILWAGIALAVNNPGQMIEHVGSVGIEFIGGYVVGRAYVRTPEVFLGLCRLLVTLVFVHVPFAVLETLTGRVLLVELLDKIPGLDTVQIVSNDKRLGLDRVQSTFAHPIHFGLFCSVVLSLCFVGLKGVMTTGGRTLASLIIFMTGFLALSSGALSALALQVGLILWAWVFARASWRWWLLVALFALAYVVVDILSNRTPIRVFMHYMTFSPYTGYVRILIFEWGFANVVGSADKGIVGSPIFGLGLEDWVRPAWMISGSMDNFWLVVTVRYGLPGFLLLAVGYIHALAKVMRRDFSADPVLTQLRLAWVFTFMGLTFVLCTVHVWGNVYSFVFFMFGAGIWLITADPRSEGAEPETGPASQEGLVYRRDLGVAPVPDPATPRRSRFSRF